jgi:2-polyprenyl-6-hydroxyphenyl methylase/3-demethylubiquinone-9 3-methyltransferase
MTTVPDYGWSSSVPAHAQSYLEPVVLNVIARARSRTPGRDGPLKVFDAGCGNGALLVRLKAGGYLLAGCDASETGIAIAQQMLGDSVRLKRLSVYDDLAACFGSDWDVVLAIEVIEHLYSPREFVKRAHALLRPGGTLILSTPYHGYLKNLMLAAVGACDRHFTALWDGGHIKFWSYRTLTTLLQEAKFEEFRFTGAGRLPYLWKSLVVSCIRGA